MNRSNSLFTRLKILLKTINAKCNFTQNIHSQPTRMSVDDCFDIAKVADIFKLSLKTDDDDVLMEFYLQAYEEIIKFFQLMGTVFGFVSSDVRSKIDILYELKKTKGKSGNFASIKTMILYEKDEGLLNENSYVSGSRTLLRLHRGLEFVYEFLNRLAELNECDKVHNCCKSAYNDTLAKHHPWIIRKGALFAMHALPTQGEMLKRVCVKNAPNQAIEALTIMLEHIKSVYDRTHKLYNVFELHELP